MSRCLVPLVLLLATCSRKPPPEETVDGWAVVRHALTSGQACFAERADYCLTDPEFIDGAVKPRLDALYGGEMPLRKVHVDAVVLEAIREYKRRCATPENVARIESLVADRYENPKSERRGDELWIDFGVVPGKLTVSMASQSLELRSSALAADGSWTSEEAKRRLLEALGKHPEEPRLVLVVIVPAGRELVTITLRYDRRSKVLTLSSGPHRFQASEVEEAGLAALKITPKDLKSCETAGDCTP